MWYNGTVKAYTDAVDTHLVVYDDGDQRNEALSDPSLSWELLQPLEPPPLPPAASSARPPPRQPHAKPAPKPPAPKPPPAPMPSKPKAKPKPKAKAAEPPPLPSPKPADAKAGRKPAKRPRVEGASQPSTAAAAAAAAPLPQLWPGGGTWMPSTGDWGTRAKDAYGCGKCRWHPRGCRGCIAAAASFVPAAVPPLPRGEVSLPRYKAHKHVYAHTEGPGEAARLTSLKEMRSRVRVQGGATQSDPRGHGVVATSRLRRGESRTHYSPLACCTHLSLLQPPLACYYSPLPGETLLDWSVFFVARPAEYALAHLPQYHALEFGKSGYFLLREPALGLCSLTYFVNEASEHWSPRAATEHLLRPNVAYKVVRPRDGGVALGLLCLEVLLPLTMLHPLAFTSGDERLTLTLALP